MTTTYYDVRDDPEPFDFREYASAEAEQLGIPVEQLLEQAGLIQTEGGSWQIKDVQHSEHRGMRYADDELAFFRTEDPLSIELGDRVAECLVLENGTLEGERAYAQHRINCDAGIAHSTAVSRESEKAAKTFEAQMAQLDAELERGRSLLEDPDREIRMPGIEPG
jgi:hypothetical protein